MKKWIAANKWWLLTAAWIYTLSFVFNHYWSKSSSYESVTKSFSQRLDRQLNDFQSFCSDTATIRRLAAFQIDSTPRFSGDKDVYYYLFSDSPEGMVLRYWSSASVVPAPDDVPYHDTVKLINYRNGIYVLASHWLPNNLLTAVQLTLVKQEYYVENKSLKTEYAGFPDLENHVDISETETAYPVKTGKDQTLFYLKPIGGTGIFVFNWISLSLQVITTVLLMIFFYRVGLGFAQSGRILLAVAWMVIAVLLIRLSIGYINFPVNVGHLNLFNPVKQNGDWFFPSLGALLLNLLGSIWLIFFSLRTRSIWQPKLEKLPLTSKKWIAATAILSLLLITFFLSQLIMRIVLQPDISFDVSNFFSLGSTTVCAIICIYFLCVLHYRLMHMSNQFFMRVWPAKAYLKYLIAAVIGLLLLTLFIQIVQATILVIVLLWLLASLLLEDKLPKWFFSSMERVARFVFWLVWYAFASTLIVQSQHDTKEQTRKLQMARNLAEHSDTEAESVIYQSLNNAAIKELRDRPLLAQDSAYNSHLKQNIIRLFTGRLAGYTTTLYYFDSTKRPYYNTDSTTYATLNTIVEEEGKPTRFDGIYFYEKDFDTFGYIIRQQLQQDSLNAGYLFITCIPAFFNSEALVPELFKPLQENTENATLYNHAIYDHGILLSSTRNFPFTMGLPKGEKMLSDYEIKTMNGKKTLWYNAGNQRIIIIVKSTSLYNEIVTLFAYIFGCFIIVYLIELFLAHLLTGAYNLRPWWRMPQLSIRSKIRHTVILISLLSFLLIGVTTVYFFINRYQSANYKRLTQLIAQVENDLQTLADIEGLFEQPNYPVYRNDYKTNSSTVRLVAELLNTGINLFNLQGDLTATSQELIYDRGIIAPKMNPVAYHKMAVQQQVQYLQTESIGNLDYLGIYLPVRSANDGAPIGFINIPYFASQVELNQEISNFLVTLINLIAFIFIISGIVAFFITNSLTSSFFIIGEKMKAVSLGTTNEPIIWNRKDEIGVLVKQYNKMLEQLEDSARKLATSERESAWREMAKQVAHEIKNPLTPMKLNLQYLQRQIENNSPNIREMTKTMAVNLVTQIDHLSQIASDFSQFARINISRTEQFDLHEVLKQIIMLYNMDSNICITWNRTAVPIMIEADRTHVNRLFTNLIKNASEAVTDRKALITITEQPEPSAVLIAVTDNGPGIPPEMTDQLFKPNFTTKNSGMGLGLAICKDIVERTGGTIWFQSGNGKQTTFFVRLPVIEE